MVGVIGRNGAGKSTLLKILSRITEPTEGRAEVHGRVGSLLEVGTGFHPELTGRENILLNGAILGMRRAEVLGKFDDIVEFAEIGRYLDTPVKRYSSGMYVRLAFAVAAHLEPEILVVDEVLAVGDAAFQKKCMGRMGDVARGGRTVLFVSHNVGAIQSLTTRCLYLRDGRVASVGPTQEIVGRYVEDSLHASGSKHENVEFFRRNRNPDAAALFRGVWVGDSPEIIPRLASGARLTVNLEIDVLRPIHGALVTLILKALGGHRVTTIHSADKGFRVYAGPGRVTLRLHVHDLPLSPGRYSADIGIGESVEVLAWDVLLDVPLVEVAEAEEGLHWANRPWGVLQWTRVQWEESP